MAVKRKKFKELNIGVLMGGLSAEREISLRTGKSIVKELKKQGHIVKTININNRKLDKIINAKVDVVLNALHGTYGEDGVMQGILDFLNIPYAGSGVLSSAMAMNKVLTKEVIKTAGLDTAKWQVVTDVNSIKMKYPLVLKPIDNGSSAGIYIVKSKKEALKVFPKIRKFGKEVLVEEFIKGVEISVPVLEDNGLDAALPVIEIIPTNEFYDYESKYTDGMSTHIIPARISKSLLKKAGKTAVKVHKLLLCEGYSRTDMIVKGEKLYVIEINTLPGMTSVSLIPESAKAAGISFYQLLSILIKGALNKKDA